VRLNCVYSLAFGLELATGFRKNVYPRLFISSNRQLAHLWSRGAFGNGSGRWRPLPAGRSHACAAQKLPKATITWHEPTEILVASYVHKERTTSGLPFRDNFLSHEEDKLVKFTLVEYIFIPINVWNHKF
jgi:hypothetical protein